MFRKSVWEGVSQVAQFIPLAHEGRVRNALEGRT